MRTLLLPIFLISIVIACSNPEDELLDTPSAEPSKVQVKTLVNIEAFDAIDFGNDGNLYASSYSKDIVYKIDKSGGHEVFVSNQDGAAGIEFDSSGNMYLARYEGRDVVKISSKGEVKNVHASGFQGPIGLEFDSEGNLYVSNHLASYVSKISVTGQLTKFTIPNFPSSSSLTLDDLGNIYVTSYEQGRILKIDGETGAVSNLLTSTISGFGYITFANNEFYATNIIGNKVYRISMTGEIEVIAGTGKAGYTDGAGNFAELTRPLGITTNLRGDTLYVADLKTIRIITNY